MDNIKKHILMTIALAAFLPLVTFAQTTKVCKESIDGITDILCKVGSILNLAIPILIMLGVVYFIWGIITYVIAGDDEAKKTGRSRIVYGIIGFVAIFALKGIIGTIISTFGLDPGSADYINNFVQDNQNLAASSTFNCSLSASPKLGDLFQYGTCIINGAIIPFIGSLAVATFMWGVVQYVINSGDETKKDKGRQFMIWGIIGLTVMVGVWGIVRILGSTFGIEYAIPQLK